MEKSTMDLFNGLPEHCFEDDTTGRNLLKTISERLKSIEKPLYVPAKKWEYRYKFIFEFYNELRYGNYSRAYETLRYMGNFMNLCSSEMIEILSTTISSMTEEEHESFS